MNLTYLSTGSEGIEIRLQTVLAEVQRRRYIQIRSSAGLVSAQRPCISQLYLPENNLLIRYIQMRLSTVLCLHFLCGTFYNLFHG